MNSESYQRISVQLKAELERAIEKQKTSNVAIKSFYNGYEMAIERAMMELDVAQAIEDTQLSNWCEQRQREEEAAKPKDIIDDYREARVAKPLHKWITIYSNQ